MRHPINQRWIILTNFHYNLSDDPTCFSNEQARLYDNTYLGRPLDMGFAGEMIIFENRWYRSGVIGRRDYWKLGFTEVEWDPQGAFCIIKPSVLAQI